MIKDLGIVEDPVTRARRHRIEFSLRGQRNAAHVYLVGPFCCWYPGAFPMERTEDGWRRTLDLHPGEVRYNFVPDSYLWLADPDNPLRATNPLQLACSAVRVGADLLHRRSTPGAMDLQALYHDQSSLYLDIDGDRVWFRLRARKGEVGEASVVLAGAEPERSVPMERIWDDGVFDYFEAAAPHDGVSRYWFRVAASGAGLDGQVALLGASGGRLCPNGAGETPALREGDGFPLAAPTGRAFAVPDWARGAVFYQIMPDRFRNGDPSNDLPGTLPWDSQAKGDDATHFGGDLHGITQRLDYLADLGVQALYLTPIFRSKPYHKYTITDYMQVAAEFGGNDALMELVREAHARGIRVILDGVFRSTGDRFFAFADVVRNQEASKHKDWYCVRKFPVGAGEPAWLRWVWLSPLPARWKWALRRLLPPSYDSFSMQYMFVGEVPKTNLLHAAARDYFLDVGERWLRDAGTDGWRLDVAHGIPREFWTAFRARMKKVNPDALLFGEVWGAGDVCEARDWVSERVFDGAMNYWLYGTMVGFFAKDDMRAGKFARRLGELRASLPPKALHTMYNMISSHDTSRFLSLCGGDRARFRLAATFQMTFPGMPAIYYGDEIGMEGMGPFSDNRRPMPWDEAKWDRTLLDHYRALTALRRDHPALVRGDFRILQADDETNVVVFERVWEADRVVVALNNSGRETEAMLPPAEDARSAWRDLMTGGIAVPRTGAKEMRITLASRSGRVFGFAPEESRLDASAGPGEACRVPL